MTEEIKEILDYLKDEDEYYKKAEEVIVGYGDLVIEKEDIDKLLDYITNLQQENERLKEKLENKLTPEELVNMLNQELVRQNKCYKSICEKAIEYIKEEYDVEPKELYGLVSADELLNILNGSDENE